MTEDKKQELPMSRTKMNQDVYKEIYKDDETEFSRETYRKESKINDLFKEDNLDDTFELDFSDMEQRKKRDKIAIESFIDVNKPVKAEKVDPRASLDEYFMAEQEPVMTGEPLISYDDSLENETDQEIDEELNAILEQKYQELSELRDSLEKAKVEVTDDHSKTIDTEMINALLNPEPLGKEELLGDQEVETEELEDFIINSLIDNINGPQKEVEKPATQELTSEQLFELTSTLSVEGLSEIEDSIKRNNQIIKGLILFLIVIICILVYLFISGS